MNRIADSRTVPTLLLGAVITLAVASSTVAASEPCGTGSYPFPYTDVASVGDPFCPGIMEAYITGVSKGTTPTTFSPNNTVTRVQMTTFLQRSLDQGLKRASRSAALNKWWTTQSPASLQTIVVGGIPQLCASDGSRAFVTTGSEVVEVDGITGKVLNTWTGALNGTGIVLVAGKVYVAGQNFPGTVYMIDRTQPPGPVTVVANNLGNAPFGMSFDGAHLWTANTGGSVSIITLQATPPYPVTTVVPTGAITPLGILYTGSNIWFTDGGAGTLVKVDAAGAVLQTVPVGGIPQIPAFDGTNIVVPNFNDNSLTVVQESTGNVVATIIADANNKLMGPAVVSSNGKQHLVTNYEGSSVTLFNALDLSFLGNIPTGPSTVPQGACWWVTSESWFVTERNTGHALIIDTSSW